MITQGLTLQVGHIQIHMGSLLFTEWDSVKQLPQAARLGLVTPLTHRTALGTAPQRSLWLEGRLPQGSPPPYQLPCYSSRPPTLSGLLRGRGFQGLCHQHHNHKRSRFWGPLPLSLRRCFLESQPNLAIVNLTDFSLYHISPSLERLTARLSTDSTQSSPSSGPWNPQVPRVPSHVCGRTL